ncbi:MAG: PEP-CTERM sorting domain-containing protein [Pirellulaceae bacterium]
MWTTYRTGGRRTTPGRIDPPNRPGPTWLGNDGTGNCPVLDFQAVGVPEPDTMILAAIGLLGVIGAMAGRNRVS